MWCVILLLTDSLLDQTLLRPLWTFQQGLLSCFCLHWPILAIGYLSGQFNQTNQFNQNPPSSISDHPWYPIRFLIPHLALVMSGHPSLLLARILLGWSSQNPPLPYSWATHSHLPMHIPELSLVSLPHCKIPSQWSLYLFWWSLPWIKSSLTGFNKYRWIFFFFNTTSAQCIINVLSLLIPSLPLIPTPQTQDSEQ